MSEKVLFLDIETTGLDPAVDKILEVAAAVVDQDVNVLARFEMVVSVPMTFSSSIAGWPTGVPFSEWCYNTHKASGLLNDVWKSKHAAEDVDFTLLKFIVTHFGDAQPELAGNSIHFDKKFLDAQFPMTRKALNYRLQDVSGAARLLKRFAGIVLPSQPPVTHRAMADVDSSIETLRLLVNALKLRP